MLCKMSRSCVVRWVSKISSLIKLVRIIKINAKKEKKKPQSHLVQQREDKELISPSTLTRLRDKTLMYFRCKQQQVSHMIHRKSHIKILSTHSLCVTQTYCMCERVPCTIRCVILGGMEKFNSVFEVVTILETKVKNLLWICASYFCCGCFVSPQSNNV